MYNLKMGGGIGGKAVNGDWRDDIEVDLHYMARAWPNTMCGFRPCIASQVFRWGGGLVDLPNTAPLGTAGNTVVFGKWAHFGPNEQRH